jgi:hypothetical protein
MKNELPVFLILVIAVLFIVVHAVSLLIILRVASNKRLAITMWGCMTACELTALAYVLFDKA